MAGTILIGSRCCIAALPSPRTSSTRLLPSPHPATSSFSTVAEGVARSGLSYGRRGEKRGEVFFQNNASNSGNEPKKDEEDAAAEDREGGDAVELQNGRGSWKWPPWDGVVPHRYKLIGATSLAFVICNMDKVNLSIAIIPMSHQFGWNSSMAGLVQSSFFWGYTLSQLPGGWLAKIVGGRKVLGVGVLTWSLATAFVPLAAGFMPGLIMSRILVGMGEGVSPSAATEIIARTIPVNERSRAVAFVFGGLSVGSVMGLLLAPTIIQSVGWETVFYIFGLTGVLWYIGFDLINERKALLGIDESSRHTLEGNF